MSSYEIRRRALLAAAKVSFSFAAFGCGAADVPSAPEIDQRLGTPVCEQNDGRCSGAAGQAGDSGYPGNTAGGGGSSSSLPQAGAGGGGAEVGGQAGQGGETEQAAGQAGQGQAGQVGGEGCGANTEVPYDAAQVKCCMDRITVLFPEPFMDPPETVSAEDTACCNVLNMAFANPDKTELEVPWEIANRCCALPDFFQVSAACTPWGPPSPPEMIPGLFRDFSWLGEAA